MQSDVVRVPGAELWVELTGKGPPVVLIHGFTLDARMWGGVVAALSPEHSVLSYDVRGFGRSSMPAEPYAHRDDLRALLDAKRLDHHASDRCEARAAGARRRCAGSHRASRRARRASA